MPTRKNLLHRHIPIPDVSCPVCESGTKTVLHVLVQCSYAQDVWIRANVGVIGGEEGCFMDWLRNMFDVYRKELWSRIAVVCWSLWRNSNCVVWEGKKHRLQWISVQAATLLSHWNAAQDQTRLVQSANHDVGLRDKRTCPDMHRVKLMWMLLQGAQMAVLE